MMANIVLPYLYLINIIILLIFLHANIQNQIFLVFFVIKFDLFDLTIPQPKKSICFELIEFVMLQTVMLE